MVKEYNNKSEKLDCRMKQTNSNASCCSLSDQITCAYLGFSSASTISPSQAYEILSLHQKVH